METVRFEVADRVATITLDRPERKNAMNQQMKDELRACWQRVKAEPDIWAAVVTGAGRSSVMVATRSATSKRTVSMRLR